MDHTAPRSGVCTGIPLNLSAETLSVPELRVPVGIGYTYREKATGAVWTLTALRSGRSVILQSPEGEVRDRVGVDTTLPDDYEHVGCNHATNCCTLHSTHVMPHRGCMMR